MLIDDPAKTISIEVWESYMARNYFNYSIKQEDRPNWTLVVKKWKSTATTTYKGKEISDYLGTLTIPKPVPATKAQKPKKITVKI